MRVPALVNSMRRLQQKLQRCIDAWMRARVVRQSGPIRVRHRRVYILPTRFGFAYALLLVVLLIGAMNYGNSMAFMLCFLLTSLGLLGTYHTHANLANLLLSAGATQAVFSGETAGICIRIDNPSAQARPAIRLCWRRGPDQAETIAELGAMTGAAVSLPLPASRRGWLRAGRFRIASEYPLGLFHAWTWAELDITALVFPRPAPPGAMPPASRGDGRLHAAGDAGQDEFSGLRAFQRGDSARAIHWKSLPKASSPLVKQFHAVQAEQRWLDWNTLQTADHEARLSQLTRWVLDAELQHCRYGLRLPGLSIAPGDGEAHRYQCLKALALFEI